MTSVKVDLAIEEASGRRSSGSWASGGAELVVERTESFLALGLSPLEGLGVKEPGVVQAALGIVVPSKHPDLLSWKKHCCLLGPDEGLLALETFFGPDAVFYLITAVRD